MTWIALWAVAALHASAVDAVPVAADDGSKAVDAINDARRSCHLEPVVLDPTLSRGCYLHAEYLVQNWGRPEIQGLQMHHEQASLPGYSKEGASAGPQSDIDLAWADPREAVADWLDSLYHRIPILSPELRRVGFGAVQVPSGPIVSVLMFGPLEGRKRYPVEYLLPKKFEWKFSTVRPVVVDAADAAGLAASVGQLVYLRGNVVGSRPAPPGGLAYLTLFGGDRGGVVPVFVEGSAGDGSSAGPLGRFVGERIDVLGTLLSGPQAVPQMRLADVSSIRVVPSEEPPELEEHASSLSSHVGQIVRLRGRIRFVKEQHGDVLLFLGAHDRQVTVVVDGDCWRSLKLAANASLIGRAVTARGLLRGDSFGLDLSVTRPEWVEVGKAGR